MISTATVRQPACFKGIPNSFRVRFRTRLVQLTDSKIVLLGKIISLMSGYFVAISAFMIVDMLHQWKDPCLKHK
ncbi:MAG: hypothetical protein HOK67_04290 [Deltaproteobacteria bacterium]|jgi:hypothetical protein|nr:hypothetical protein [Deltaproteobacteria bacterium]MBT6499100.1 hypothetical protein [Deltaproteobacteria bacterium]MBT7710134.1 hypothetical protein [Deltaproteobacteria bacterium]